MEINRVCEWDRHSCIYIWSKLWKNSTFLSEILIKILNEFRGHQIFWSEYRLVVGSSKLEFWLRFLKNSTWIPWSSDRQLLKHSDDISSSDNYQEFHGRLIFYHNKYWLPVRDSWMELWSIFMMNSIPIPRSFDRNSWRILKASCQPTTIKNFPLIWFFDQNSGCMFWRILMTSVLVININNLYWQK